MTCDTSATPYQGWLACFQKSKLHQTCARAFFIGQMTLFALSTKWCSQRGEIARQIVLPPRLIGGGGNAWKARRASAEGSPPGARMLRDGECPYQFRRLGLSYSELLCGACAQQQMPRIFERRVGQGKGERCSLLLREVAL
jgi:hypothetical protein